MYSTSPKPLWSNPYRFDYSLLCLFIYPQSPLIALESPSPCLSTQSGCFPPTRFVALKCLKCLLWWVLEPRRGRSDESFTVSLSVILNLLHYSLQTLPHCTEGSHGCKHGGKDNSSALILVIYGCLPAAPKHLTSLNTPCWDAVGSDCMVLTIADCLMFLTGRACISDHLLCTADICYNVNNIWMFNDSCILLTES